MDSVSAKCQTFVALSVLGAVKLVAVYRLHRRRPDAAECVGVVSGLSLFPVKSCRALNLSRANCTYRGLSHPEMDLRDRHFMVVQEDGNMLTARQEPKLVTVTATFKGDLMCLNAPEMDTLEVPFRPHGDKFEVWNCRVWGDPIEAAYCGREATQWFSQLLDRPGHLVYAAPSLEKRELLKISQGHWHKTTRPQDVVAFSDFAPYMVISDASLADLNSHLKNPVTMTNFRPNITISGCQPFDEDTWDAVYIGKAKFVNLKPCERCVFTTVDPKTGIKDQGQEPLKTLKSYRVFPKFKSTSPLFGVNLFLDLEGEVRVGDPVYVTRRKAFHN